MTATATSSHLLLLAAGAAAALLVSSFFPTTVAAGTSGSASREIFTLDDDVAWVVQLSDLHLSAYHPERAADLVALLPPALRAIRPSLLLITGDITDAKNKWRTSTRQDETEWIQYKSIMDTVINKSGIEKKRVFDIRGNHDKYGVPYVGNTLDYFSKYSVSSQLNRLGTIQSVSLVGHDRIYTFVGIDDTIGVGIRGPSNLFGHPTHTRISGVDSELAFWDNQTGVSLTKVVFGHFPMSFTASSEMGERYENVFAKHSVSAYICGHLHATFGKRLWRLHTLNILSEPEGLKKDKQFWEWELGDWKDSRFMRILAIDKGHVSFLDFQLPKNQKSTDAFETTILITYPPDSRSMNRNELDVQELRNDINVLVFSSQNILNVTARVLDSSRAFRVVEEIPLRPSPTIKPLFHAKWNAESYKSIYASRYWLQVSALDSQSKVTKSMMRPFSVGGKIADHSATLLALLAFDVQWENLYAILLWSNVLFVSLLLLLPKFLQYFMMRNAIYQRWSVSPGRQRKTIFRISWFLIEGSQSKTLWLAMVIYVVCLISLPWFWGHATSENGEIAKMYMYGWNVKDPNKMDMLASPDIMAITLPFMYLVVTPMFILIYGLSAEWSANCSSTKMRCLNEPISVNAGAPNRTNTAFICRICRSRIRLALLLASLVVGLIYLKICLTLMAAYGAGAVALSPVLSWAPLLLIATAVYCTMDKAELELA